MPTHIKKRQISRCVFYIDTSLYWGVLIPPNVFYQAMGQIPNHFISWHHIWALCRLCGFHSNKISLQYKKHVEDYRGEKEEIWMEQKTGAKVTISWDVGNFLLLFDLSQKTSTNPLDAFRYKLCSVLIIYQDPRSSYSKL